MNELSERTIEDQKKFKEDFFRACSIYVLARVDEADHPVNRINELKDYSIVDMFTSEDDAISRLVEKSKHEEHFWKMRNRVHNSNDYSQDCCMATAVLNDGKDHRITYEIERSGDSYMIQCLADGEFHHVVCSVKVLSFNAIDLYRSHKKIGFGSNNYISAKYNILKEVFGNSVNRWI